MDLIAKNLSDFVSFLWKLINPNCHSDDTACKREGNLNLDALMPGIYAPAKNINKKKNRKKEKEKSAKFILYFSLLIWWKLALKTIDMILFTEIQKIDKEIRYRIQWKIFWFCIKCQLISKCLFDVFNSSKKMNKNNLTWGTIVIKSKFLFVCWENWRYQKGISKLSDL